MKEQEEGQITNLIANLLVTQYDKERAEDVLLNAKGNNDDIVLNFMELSRIKQNEKQLINSIRSEMKEINFQ